MHHVPTRNISRYSLLISDLDTHLARGAFDLAHCPFDVNRVQVLHFCFRNFTYLFAGQGCNSFGCWIGCSFLQTRSFLNQERGGWAFQRKLE